LQSTVGLLTGTVVAGVTLGGLVGVLSALAMGRFGGLRVRATTMTVAAIGFVSVYLVPFVAYPPNPPAVGHGDTIGLRSTLYFTLLAISIIAAGHGCAGRSPARATLGRLVRRAGRHPRLPRRRGRRHRPAADVRRVPSDFPASVLYTFRRASLATQLTLWAVLGVFLAEFGHRLTRNARLRLPSTLRFARRPDR
jgi:predicted cobalt transporter CbtA